MLHEPPDSSGVGDYIMIKELKITMIMTSFISVDEIKFGDMVAKIVLG